MGGTYRSDQVTVFRLPFFGQESPLRRACEWTSLAENRWSHDGRKLTRYHPSGAIPQWSPR